jgi:hypothetical protein
MPLNFPSNPTPDQLWTDPNNNYTYQWKVDPDSITGQGKWITRISTDEDNLAPVSSNPGTTAPTDPFIGQFWFDTTNLILYTWCDLGPGVTWINTATGAPIV